jgi:hypothetical protein
MGQIGIEFVSLLQLAKIAPVIVLGIPRSQPDGTLQLEVRGVYTPGAGDLSQGQSIRIMTPAEAAPPPSQAPGGPPETFVFDLVSLRPAQFESMTDGQPYIVFLNPTSNSKAFILAAEKGFVSPDRFNEFREASEKLRWSGRAMNTAAGALLEMAPPSAPPGRAVRIDGLKNWPAELEGQQLTGTGLLTSDKEQLIFKEFRWQKIPPDPLP